MANDETRKPRSKRGCLYAAVVLGLLATAGAITTGVALWQIRSDEPRSYELTQAPPATGASAATASESSRAATSGTLEIDIAVANLLIVPAPAGEPIKLEAEFDERRYELQQETVDDAGGGWRYRVRLTPRGSSSLALFRVKLGATPPSLRISVPADIRLSLVGSIDRAFAAAELGGLRIEQVDLEIRSGGTKISFREPLLEPMERLSIRGRTSSIGVTGLGNASPTSSIIEQRVGELDLDLRGAWLRDADIRLRASVAGGTVWLPDDVTLEQAGAAAAATTRPGSELPRVRLSIHDRSGKLLLIGGPAR